MDKFGSSSKNFNIKKIDSLNYNMKEKFNTLNIKINNFIELVNKINEENVKLKNDVKKLNDLYNKTIVKKIESIEESLKKKKNKNT